MEGAIAEYRTAIHLAPTQFKAHTHLGVALQAQGKKADAKEEFMEALRLLPDTPANEKNIEFLRQQLRELE